MDNGQVEVSYFPFLEIAQALNKDPSKSSGRSLDYERAFQSKYKLNENMIIELTGRALNEVLDEPNPESSERARIWLNDLKDGLSVKEINDGIKQKKLSGQYKNARPDGDIIIALLQGYITLRRGT
ncbi:hypothetical protein HED22_05875 [Thalassospira sp. HF15]|uniref:hypothetical protein n=1 Tax=Thalassospira sp. HF15 TaxID=2722755 RepID=UPI00142FFA50|nr:hypothetical protein [Thalassospira sp. HF15]NIY75167.1 hypothetical protein [Thalassospira sp. HF15]